MSKKQIVILEPNYTQFPNVIIDNAGNMTEAELRIALVVVRKTFGWHKGSDRISLSQFETHSKMSRQGCIDGIRQALGDSIIKRKKKGDSFVYTIRISKADSHLASQPNGLAASQPNGLAASQRSGLPPSQRSRHTKDNVKHTSSAFAKIKHHHQAAQISFLESDDDGLESRSAETIANYAEQMHVEFGIDMPVAEKLAKLKWVSPDYLSAWKKFEQRNMQGVNGDPEHDKNVLGAGFYVTMIRQGKFPDGDRARSKSISGGRGKSKRQKYPSQNLVKIV